MVQGGRGDLVKRAWETVEGTVAPPPCPTEPAFRKALGLFEDLRRLGVPSERIYATFDGANQFFLKCKPVGSADILLRVDTIEATDVDLDDAWRAAAAWWNSPLVSDAERAVVQAEYARESNRVALVQLITSRRWA